jgi:hypothetical protein
MAEAWCDYYIATDQYMFKHYLNKSSENFDEFLNKLIGLLKGYPDGLL